MSVWQERRSVCVRICLFFAFGVFLSAKLFLSLYTAGDYGYFTDELYLLSCAKRLSLGYPDNPPLAALILSLTTRLAGESMFAIRLPSALASACGILLAAILAKKLVADAAPRHVLLVQLFTLVMLLIAPYLLMFGAVYSMMAFEHLFWAGAALVLFRILSKDWRLGWLLLGVIAGLGLLNRHSMLLFGAALVLALALTPYRRHLLTWQLWAGGGVALIIFSPNIYWQWENGWPTIEYLEQVAAEASIGLLEVPLLMHPMLIPLWLLGIAFAFWSRNPLLRLYTLMFIATLAILAVTGGKGYYLAPAFFLLAPVSAIALMRATEARPWVPVSLIMLLCVGGAITAPFCVPLCPTSAYAPTDPRMKHPLDTREEMPFTFQGRFGWPELALFMHRNYNGLPETVRENTVAYVTYYGEAAALDFYSSHLTLPPVFCSNNVFYYYPPPECTENYLVLLPFPLNLALPFYFDHVAYLDTYSHPYTYRFLQYRMLYLCQGPRFELEQLWPRLKRLG